MLFRSITVPAQDMVLGLYYITKLRRSVKDADGNYIEKVKGEGLTFYGPEEALIAYNEGKVDIHAVVKVMVNDVDEQGSPITHLVETSVGRVIVRCSICWILNRKIMITSVTLDNFKCFEHFYIPLRKMTLIAGVNGAGKSSVIQSLLLPVSIFIKTTLA